MKKSLVVLIYCLLFCRIFGESVHDSKNQGTYIPKQVYEAVKNGWPFSYAEKRAEKNGAYTVLSVDSEKIIVDQKFQGADVLDVKKAIKFSIDEKNCLIDKSSGIRYTKISDETDYSKAVDNFIIENRLKMSEHVEDQLELIEDNTIMYQGIAWKIDKNTDHYSRDIQIVLYSKERRKYIAYIVDRFFLLENAEAENGISERKVPVMTAEEDIADFNVFDNPLSREFTFMNSDDEEFFLYQIAPDESEMTDLEFKEILPIDDNILCKIDYENLRIFWFKGLYLIRTVTTSKDWHTKQGISVGDAAEKVKEVYENFEINGKKAFSVVDEENCISVSARNRNALENMKISFFTENGFVTKIDIRAGDINWNQYENPDYDYENGTVIFDVTRNDKRYINRLYSREIEIGNYLKKEQYDIYSSYENGELIGRLDPGKNVEILSVLSIEYLKPSRYSDSPKGEVWYQVRKNGITGWIQENSKSAGSNPFYENDYQILERINSNGKIWTSHQYKSSFCVWHRVVVRETPGFDAKELYIFNSENINRQMFVKVIEITGETEQHGRYSDYWLKMEYEPGLYGWVHGSDLSTERGGPKYYLPDETVDWKISSWYEGI